LRGCETDLVEDLDEYLIRNEMAAQIYISMKVFSYRFAATRSWRSRSTKLSATTELDTKHKASFNH
jgi:hypothetical protein